MQQDGWSKYLARGIQDTSQEYIEKDDSKDPWKHAWRGQRFCLCTCNPINCTASRGVALAARGGRQRKEASPKKPLHQGWFMARPSFCQMQMRTASCIFLVKYMVEKWSLLSTSTFLVSVLFPLALSFLCCIWQRGWSAIWTDSERRIFCGESSVQRRLDLHWMHTKTVLIKKILNCPKIIF